MNKICYTKMKAKNPSEYHQLALGNNDQGRDLYFNALNI